MEVNRDISIIFTEEEEVLITKALKLFEDIRDNTAMCSFISCNKCIFNGLCNINTIKQFGIALRESLQELKD